MPFQENQSQKGHESWRHHPCTHDGTTLASRAVPSLDPPLLTIAYVTPTCRAAVPDGRSYLGSIHQIPACHEAPPGHCWRISLHNLHQRPTRQPSYSPIRRSSLQRLYSFISGLSYPSLLPPVSPHSQESTCSLPSCIRSLPHASRNWSISYRTE